MLILNGQEEENLVVKNKRQFFRLGTIDLIVSPWQN